MTRVCVQWLVVVETMGLEPTTPCLQSRCSSQLSYVPGVIGAHRTVLGTLEGPLMSLNVPRTGDETGQG